MATRTGAGAATAPIPTIRREQREARLLRRALPRVPPSLTPQLLLLLLAPLSPDRRRQFLRRRMPIPIDDQLRNLGPVAVEWSALPRHSGHGQRHILVDYARRQRRLKRGGERRPVTLDEAMILADQRAETLLELDEALSALGALNERLSRVVECRFFAGLTAEETAAALQVTTRTVERDWRKARAWLFNRLHGE